MKTIKFSTKLLILLLLFPALLWAADGTGTNTSGDGAGTGNPDVPTNEWPSEFLDRLNEDISDGFDSAGERISNSIFESISDLELLDMDISDIGDVQLEVQRKVYNNHDITDSWTVIDRFSLPVRLPFLVTDSVGVGNGTFSLTLGANLRLESYNIRQVLPKDFETLRKVEDIQADIDENRHEFDENEAEEDESEQEIVAEAEGLPPILWNSDNPRTRARYSNLLNLFTSPLRLPLTPWQLKRMKVGEITSHALDGSIQLSGSVGWGSINIPGLSSSDDYSVGLGVTTYLNGRYRISVYKESDRYVQVKLTKRRAKGIAGSIGTSTPKYELFKGIVVLGKEVLRIRERLIPFNFYIGKEIAKSFDVGYRFDLDNPKAKEAYFKSVFGRFKKAEELSQNKNGVKRVYDRVQVSNSRFTSKRIELSLLFEHRHRTNNTYSDAVITIDGKKKHYFRSLNENYRSWDTLWGSSETQHYRFNMIIDADQYAQASNQGMVMHIEGRLEDRRTNGKEIRRYMHEVELATGKYGTFPKLPAFGPFHYCRPSDEDIQDENDAKVWAESLMDYEEFDVLMGKTSEHEEKGACKKKFKLAPYGKTSFFYRVGFTRNQMEDFIDYPKKKMWRSLELAFGVDEGEWSKPRGRAWYRIRNMYASVLNVPLFLLDMNIKKGSNLSRAKKFYKNWKKLKRYKRNPKKLVEKINRLFSTTTFSFEFLNIIKTTLDKDAQIEYTINARAKKLFGQISKHGNALGTLDSFARRANQRIDFDRVGPRINIDNEAIVDAFHLDKIDKDTVKMRFRLPKTPKLIFFKADKSSNWRFYKTLARFVLANDGTFKEGYNEFVLSRKLAEQSLDQEEESDFKKILSKALFTGDYTTISMAVSLNRETWGGVTSKRIRVKEKGEEDKTILGPIAVVQ